MMAAAMAGSTARPMSAVRRCRCSRTCAALCSPWCAVVAMRAPCGRLDRQSTLFKPTWVVARYRYADPGPRARAASPETAAHRPRPVPSARLRTRSPLRGRHARRPRVRDRVVAADRMQDDVDGGQHPGSPIRQSTPKPCQTRAPDAWRSTVKKVVLAYSGGLDTSVAVAWLREQYGVEVITLTVDLGGGSLRPDVAERALRAGASRAYVVDGRERFVRQFVWPEPAGQRAATRASTRWPRRWPGHSSPSCSSRSPIASAPAPSPTAAPARATTRSASTWRSMPSTRGWRSSHPCASAWASRASRRSTTRSSAASRSRHASAPRYSIDVNLWGRSVRDGRAGGPLGHAARQTPTSGPWSPAPRRTSRPS